MKSPRVQVLVPFPVDKSFSYQPPEGVCVQPGNLVRVVFRGRPSTGIVVDENTQDMKEISASSLLKIQEVYPLPPLTKTFQTFLQWVSTYTMTPKGSLCKIALQGFSPKLSSEVGTESFNVAPLSLKLTDAQQKCVTRMLPARTYEVFVLDGVTGSGKTEVYFSVLREYIAAQRQVLVLLPEIGLSHGWIARFIKVFGFKPDVWHSGISPAKKKRIWQRVAKGNAPIVLGARSALFLPFKNLGLIVVDEEHDGSFKQEEGMVYNARDMAVVRAHVENIPVILASATPALETWENCLQGKYYHLSLPQRYQESGTVTIELIDMRQQKNAPQTWISAPLLHGLGEALARQEQGLLFLNRRGYAPVTLCSACGTRKTCGSCSAWLVAHGGNGPSRLICHHCGYGEPWPKTCQACGKDGTFIPCGPGVERIAADVAKAFPQARTLIMSSDELPTIERVESALSSIHNGEVDIIIGTQLMVKGHDFERLTCVGVIDGDLGLVGSDLRAGEKTFQLLHQVAGRAGRHRPHANIFIQTYAPHHPLMQTLQRQDRGEFLAQERQMRLQYEWPPFGHLAAVIVSGLDGAAVEKAAKEMTQRAPHQEGIRLLGPAPAPLLKIRGRTRWRLLVKGRLGVRLQPFLRTWLERIPHSRHITVQVDIDPLTFL